MAPLFAVAPRGKGGKGNKKEIRRNAREKMEKHYGS